MAAAIDADFDGVDIKFWKNFLEISENARGEGLAIGFLEERGAKFLAERSVAGEDVVFLFVAGIVTDGPVGDDKVGEGISGTPVVVSAIVDGFVEDEVDDGIGERSACGAWRFFVRRANLE